MIPMATQSTVPNLTLSQDARLYKYVRLPSGWKYLRADYSESFGVKPHAVFLPKTKTPTVVEGGRYVASDGGNWHPLSPDPNEAWMLFKLYRNEGRKSQLEVKSQQLRQQLATGHTTVAKEERPTVLTVGDAIGNFLKSYRLKILSGGRKPRTYEAIEDILVAFKSAILGPIVRWPRRILFQSLPFKESPGVLEYQGRSAPDRSQLQRRSAMEPIEQKIPNYVFEDLLFQRRLHRSLNAEQEKLNALLAEHVRLLNERRALMAEIHDSVQQRWNEEAAASDTHTGPTTKGDGDAD